MAATILVFNLPADKLQKLRFTCMRLGVQVTPVPPGDWGQTMAALSGMAPRTEVAAPEETFSGDMLVMVNFTQQLANRFLSALKQGRLNIRLKAVMTPTNAQWNPVQLYRELSAEHEAIANHMKHAHEDDPAQA